MVSLLALSVVDPGFELRSGHTKDYKFGIWGAHLNKLSRAEGGVNIFGVFHVKNHDFTQKKNHIFT